MTARLSLSPGGGTGFIGTALTRLLRSRGHQVTHVSRREGEDRISWVRAESGHRRGNVSGLRNQPGAWLSMAWREPAKGGLAPVAVLLGCWMGHSRWNGNCCSSKEQNFSICACSPQMSGRNCLQFLGACPAAVQGRLEQRGG